MNKIFSIPRGILLIFFFSLIVMGCGGGGGSSGNGGGGGQSQISYVGLTTPAAVTDANAEEIIFESLGAAEIAGAFTLSAASNKEQSQEKQSAAASINPNFIDLPIVLKNTSKDIFIRTLKRNQQGPTLLAIHTETDVENGNCGGTAEYTINFNDTAWTFDGTFAFKEYCEDGMVISGDTDINGTWNSAGEILTITFSFEDLIIDEFTYKGNIFLNDAVTPKIVTQDLLVKDNAANKVYWARDYSILITEISSTQSEIEIAGQYYNPDYGYVTVSTPEPLLISTEDWPILGILLCVGDRNTKARLTAINESSYKIEADTDGDDIYDYHSGVLIWPGATQSAWQERSSMPTPRNFLASGTVGEKIYAIGGYYSSQTVPLNTVEEYDPSLDVWSTKTSIPTPRMRFAIGVVNNKLYAIGGRAPGYIITNAVEEFDPNTGIWTTKAPMSTLRDSLAATVVNGKIYAIGGIDGNTSLASGTVEEYDPGNDSWTTKAPMPTPRSVLTACTANGKIYAIGGSTPSGPSDVVEVYDPLTDSWSTRSSIPLNRTEHAAVSINEIIFLFGGSGSVFTGKEVEKYDPSTDAWTIKNPMPEGGTGFSAAVVNGKAYVIGAGDYLSGADSFARVYQYDPALDP